MRDGGRRVGDPEGKDVDDDAMGCWSVTVEGRTGWGAKSGGDGVRWRSSCVGSSVGCLFATMTDMVDDVCGPYERGGVMQHADVKLEL